MMLVLFALYCALMNLRHYYSLKIAIDGNFKAKLKNPNLLDVPLQDGWGYFAPDQPYTAHINAFGNEPEVCLVFHTHQPEHLLMTL